MSEGVRSPPIPAAPTPSLTGRSLPTARSPGGIGDQWSAPDDPGAVTEAYAEWLSTRWEWDWFFTGTFAPLTNSGSHTVRGWSGSDKRFRDWVSGLPAIQPYWVRAREPHQFRNATHFHALIGGVGTLRRSDAWRAWFEANGQGRVDPIKHPSEVAAYVAKYVLKAGGELVFSANADLMMKPEYRERLKV